MKKMHYLLNLKSVTGALGILSVFVVSCLIVAVFGEKELKILGIVDKGLFEALSEVWPSFSTFLYTDVGMSLCILALLIIIGLWLLRLFYRTRIVLIKHSSMNIKLKIDPDFLKMHWCKRLDVEISLINNNVVQLLKDHDNKACLISNVMIAEKRPVFYYGIAHTPLIFRFGYQMAGCTVHLLHQYRNARREHHFSELKKYDEDRMPLDGIDCVTINGATDLLFAIGATFNIKNEDLDTIDPTHIMHRCIYNIEGDLQGFDFFSSENKINAIALTLVRKIEEICKENRIQRVHIAISASVAFTFFFAQRLTTNQIPDIIVYHYEKGNSYPWGVRIKEKDAIKAVVYTGQIEL